MALLHPVVAVILLLYHQHVSGDIQENCNLTLQIISGNKSYDLTSVAFEPVTFSAADHRVVTGRGAERPAEVTVTVQLCSAGPSCAAPAAACVGPSSGDGPAPVANAGRIANNTALVVKDGSPLQLDLAPGRPCPGQGRNRNFSTSIIFFCRPSATSDSVAQDWQEQQFAVVTDCSLVVNWHTPAACPRPVSGPPSCPLLSYRPFRSRPGLAGLSAASWHAQAGGVTVQARLCGSNSSGPCDGAPICVTDPARADGQPVPVGSPDRPARLSAATNGSVTLTYGRPGEDRAQVSLQCRQGAGEDRLVIGRREEQLLHLTLETAVVCPVREVQCRVTAADGTVRDLSPLTRRTGGWETTDLSSSSGVARPGRQFYINVCRALSHDKITTLCGGVAGTAVCMQPEGGGDKISLGVVAGPPSLMPDGSISIMYTNGSRCGTGRFSSELQLVCVPADGRAIQAPVLTGHSGCRYTFLWETAAACGQQESSGSQCAVSDPLYGYRLDVSSLRRTDKDYALSLEDGRTLYLNLCGPLVRRCAGADGHGACLVYGNGTEISYGGASSRLWHVDGALFLRLTGGSPCGPGAAANHSTRVVFACDQAAPAAAQPGLVGPAGCSSYVVMSARQACPPRRAVECRTTDGRYDLSSLTVLTDNHMYREPNATYVLNVCHSVNPEEGVNCPPGSAACLVRTDGNKHRNYTSLGAVSGGPVVDTDGRPLLRYTTGQPCKGGPTDRHVSTEIHFSCDATAVGTMPRLVNTDDCLYQFEWTTASACPLREVRGTANCTVQNPQTGYRFDLSPLARQEGYTTLLRGSQSYRLNVCDGLPPTDGCSAGTGICKTSGISGSVKLSVGTANDNLIYDGHVLLLNYSAGAPCTAGRRYHTVISFFCGPEGGSPAPRVVEDTLCTVSVHWPTQLACESRVECAVDTPAGLVDLTPLIRPGGTAVHTGPGRSGRFLVNVCRPLTPAVGLPCPAGSAACLSNGTTHRGLGHVVSPPRLQKDHVSVTYEHGSPCAGQPGRNLTSELQLYCNSSRPAAMSRPEWPELADCRYTFVWRTAAACPLPPAAAQARRQCLVQRPDHTVTDLNTLTAAHVQQVHSSGQTVRLRPCQTDKLCGGAVCVGNLSYGDPAGFTVSQQSDGQTVTLHYTTDTACVQPDRSRATRGATLRFSCDPALGKGTPTVTQLTDCHVTAEWRSSAVCSASLSGGGSDTPSGAEPSPATRGTGHAVAWLVFAAVAAALVAFLVCRSRWRGWSGCCEVWTTLRRQLLSPGTRATAHYRPVRVEDPDESETALLLEAPLEQQHSPRPAARRPRRTPGESPTPTEDMIDVCLAPDSDDELLLV